MNRQWVRHAACAGLPTRHFFSDRVEPETRELCGACPVQPDCLAYAIAHDIADGIWGGLTYRERARLKHARPQRLHCRHCALPFVWQSSRRRRTPPACCSDACSAALLAQTAPPFGTSQPDPAA